MTRETPNEPLQLTRNSAFQLTFGSMLSGSAMSSTERRSA
jgi:hypothetical protein